MRIPERADAAADLHDEIARGEAADDARLDRTAAARRFEVDDVQACAARDVERVEHRFRLAVDARGRKVAVGEGDHAAVQEIERRDQLHCTKFLSTRSPAADDFSGWNCTPKTRSRCTAAVKVPL